MNPNVQVIGKKLNQRQERFLKFVQLLKEEDKLSIIKLLYDDDLCKDVLERGYYDDEQRKYLLDLRQQMDIVLHVRDELKPIYQSFMRWDITTSNMVLTQTRLEEYFNEENYE